MITVLEVVQKTTEFLAGKSVENPRLNAELLVGHALGLKRMQLYIQFERPLTEVELEKIRPLVRRRGQREPMQYIVGETDWGGLRLKVDRRALIPRPETEYLLEIIASAVTVPPARILDLGTGSGALALALAKVYGESQVTAVDQSEAALALARENSELTGLAARVQFLRSDWCAALPADAVFDLIVANPPYLSEQETNETEPEVKNHEPREALAAAEDGLSDLQTIIRGAISRLAPGGLLAMETGIRQHATLQAWCAEAGFARTESKKDLTGRDRFVLAWR